MTYLLYYQKERAEYPEEFGTNLDIKTADSIIKRLIKRFKITTHNEWRFTGGKSSHCVTWKDTGKGHFKFSKKHTSIGVICHELAHAIDIRRRGSSTHSRKHYKIMKHLIDYCRKMGYVSNISNQDVLISVTGKERQGMSTMSMQIGLEEIYKRMKK
jgi:hypothetical protein